MLYSAESKHDSYSITYSQILNLQSVIPRAGVGIRRSDMMLNGFFIIKKAGGAPAFSKLNIVINCQYTFLALITSLPSIVKSVSVSIIV